jgi:hypothetical protein
MAVFVFEAALSCGCRWVFSIVAPRKGDELLCRGCDRAVTVAARPRRVAREKPPKVRRRDPNRVREV